MGLKGYMFWVMGQLDSTCRAPPLRELRLVVRQRRHRGVAAQNAEFESKRNESVHSQAKPSEHPIQHTAPGLGFKV
jgi:hypothetical protein